MVTNLQPYNARTYLANIAKEITTKAFDEANIVLSAYSIDADRLNRIAPAKRISGTPSVKLRPVALGDLHNPVCGDWSDAVTLGAALTTGQGLRITLDSAEAMLAKNILGIQVAVQATTGALFQVCSTVALPAEFIRYDKTPDVDIIIDLDILEGGWPIISEVKAVAPAKLYGGLPVTWNLGLGENGITLPHSIKSFESSTDGVTATYKYDSSFGAKFSVNPADEEQLRRVLSALGYNYFNDTSSNYGTALESTLNTVCLDLDLPYITSSGLNRIFVFGVNNQTLAEATLSAAINAKNPFEIDFKWFKTPYFHQSQQVYASNK